METMTAEEPDPIRGEAIVRNVLWRLAWFSMLSALVPVFLGGAPLTTHKVFRLVMTLGVHYYVYHSRIPWTRWLLCPTIVGWTLGGVLIVAARGISSTALVLIAIGLGYGWHLLRLWRDPDAVAFFDPYLAVEPNDELDEQLPQEELIAAETQFSAGQVWRYHTRQGEESSLITIGHVHEVQGNKIVHIKFTGLQIRNPKVAGGISSILPHAPISEEALRSSVISLVGPDGNLAGIKEGYSQWAAAKGGTFTVPAKEIVNHVEKTLNGNAA